MMNNKTLKLLLTASSVVFNISGKCSPVDQNINNEQDTPAPKNISMPSASSIPETLIEAVSQRKYLFSEPQIDKNAWFRRYYTCPGEQTQLIALLEYQAAKKDELAQEFYYSLLTKPLGTINLQDSEKAQTILNLGLESNFKWAHKAVVNGTHSSGLTKEDVRQSRLFLAKTGDKQQEEILDREFGYQRALAQSFINEILKEKKPRARKRIFDDFVTRWKEISYYKPFSEAFELGRSLHISEIKSLQKYAAQFGHIPSLKSLAIQASIHDSCEVYLTYAIPLVKLEPDTTFLYSMGRLYESELNNPAEALKYYVHSASLGNALAMTCAGNIYEQSFGGQVADKKRALSFYLQAAKMGESLGYLGAGLLYYQGFEGQPVDKQRALELYLQAAKIGDSRGCLNAGILYFNGFEGQPVNKQRALELYIQGANMGNASCMVNAGLLYFQGFEGQPVDKQRALELFLQAGEKGESQGYYHAGLLYIRGFKGQPVDKQRAFNVFIKGANMGNAGCMINAGGMYTQGFEGQPVDKKKALELYLQAAKMGDSLGYYNAGLLYAQGFEGQPVDKKEALKWFNCGAEKGLKEAMMQLGYYYLESNAPDLEKAYFWLEKAANLGEENAQRLLKESQKDLSTNPMNEALEPQEEDKEFIEALNNAENPKFVEDVKEGGLLKMDMLSETNYVNESENKPATEFFLIPDSTSNKEEDSSILDEEAKAEMQQEAEHEPIAVPRMQEKLSNNPKRARELLRQSALAMKSRREVIQQAPKVLSDKKAKDTAYMILSDHRAETLNKEDLERLFKEDYFSSQVRVKETKSGIQLEAHHISKKIYMTAGTHKNHNKNYKGFHQEFLKDLKKVLALFDVTQEMTQ